MHQQGYIAGRRGTKETVGVGRISMISEFEVDGRTAKCAFLLYALPGSFLGPLFAELYSNPRPQTGSDSMYLISAVPRSCAHRRLAGIQDIETTGIGLSDGIIYWRRTKEAQGGLGLAMSGTDGGWWDTYGNWCYDGGWYYDPQVSCVCVCLLCGCVCVCVYF
jgi:hypothetical protein